ncbi:site-specific integrase [Weeksellaceae bacterium KMM 9713]|uniref:Site-specific integrase n=1 Tax=Profundicola chukchiensis TaxID=2961959 RepID=A0A9X4RTU2_9FLAO|nr:phage integrase SAM-like domain-containing protein [Profundicola chukchiensis]MDG4944986.1 site-specific integrase [Profundicola chukchiensis]
MSSINFYLRGNEDLRKIYVRLSLGTEKKRDPISNRSIKDDDGNIIYKRNCFRCYTGLQISIKDWSKKNLPKQSQKAIRIKLIGLKNELTIQANEAYMNKEVITTKWLKNQVDRFIAGKEINTKVSDDLISFIEYYVEVIKQKNELSRSTIQKYINLKRKIKEFQKFQGVTYRRSNFDEDAFLEFYNFLITEDGLMKSTANRTLKNLKTVLRYARSKSLEVSNDLDNVKTPSIKGFKVWLSFGELKRIMNTNILNEDLNSAKDWLIIGCYTGQRVSDLLRMNKNMIYSRINSDGDKFYFIELIQKKNREKNAKEGRDTSAISIPIHYEVQRILDKRGGEFPPIFSTDPESNATLFNKHIKTVCEIAGIDELVEGKVFNEVLKRNEIKTTEKYNLISSHICRRSFATNFYGDKRFSTPQIMAITGHKQESVFLAYIGKQSTDYAMATAETFAQIERSQRQIV